LLHKKSKVNVHNNTILITGGGSGIGFALANEFLKHNNKVIITGRNAEKLSTAKKKLPSLEVIQSDISNEDSVQRLVEEVKHNHPGLNFLVNNAGIMRLWNIQREGTSIEEQKKEILINLFGTVQLTQSFIPHLLKQKASVVLNVSSGLAFVPMPVAPIYNATKAALHSYSISIRQQLKNTGIKVIELMPAAIETDMAKEIAKNIGGESDGPKMSPEKLAALTLKALKNDSYEIRPGMANALYLINRFFPGIAERMIQKQSNKILRKL
jgi:uncharacterized oxidoreductase